MCGTIQKYPAMTLITLMVVLTGCVTKVNEQESSGTFTDSRDGQSYTWVKIGSQVWMADNLNYVPPGQSSWCYDDDSANCVKNGRLYDWYTAVADTHGNGKDICPVGWHLPGDDEWKTLETTIGMSPSAADSTDFRGTDEGKKLKSGSWGGTDDYGFCAVPAGYRYTDGSFFNLDSSAYFWTATEYTPSRAWQRYLSSDNDNIYRHYTFQLYGLCIRCLQD